MKNIKIILLLVLFLVLAYFVSVRFFNGNNFEFINKNLVNNEFKKQKPEDFNSKTAIFYKQKFCQNKERRSIAVMLSNDNITRPLSGISEADIVFEMPVITDSITRLMAVFGCNFPVEIGSIRSARHDFIDLANSIDAIFAHWGGSHFALDRLKTGVIDNLDALSNPNNVFYRKKNLPAPHNGFTSGKKLLETSKKLGFRMKNNFKGFPRADCERENEQQSKCKGVTDGILKIGYPGIFNVVYRYDAKTNLYIRWRGEKKEIDKNNNKQVAVKNVVVMYVKMKQIEGDYNDVELNGKGRAEFYVNGKKIDGIWKMAIKTKSASLNFYNNSGEEIKFANGNIWIEIIQTDQKTSWVSK